MTWPDYIVIVLCVLVGIVEAKRGFVVAIIDMVGIIITVEVASVTYLQFVSPSMSYCAAYLTAVGIGVVVVAAVTTLLKRQTQFDVGSFDNSLGGIFGIITGLVLSHAMYGAVILGYQEGMASPVYAGSLLAGQVYELNAWHGFLGFMSRVGTTDVAR